MRIAVTADLHLNNATYGIMKDGLPLKARDSYDAFDFLVDQCIEREVNRIIVVGDVYETPHPTSLFRSMTNIRLQRLLQADMQVVLMVGNHDATRDHHALMPLVGWHRVLRIVDEPVIEHARSFNAAYIPHSSEIERGEKTFSATISELMAADETYPNAPVRLFFGHFGVNGAHQNDHSVSNQPSDVKTGELARTGATRVFLGHFHMPQELRCDVKATYVGSLQRHSMHEIGDVKGFTIIDTNTAEEERVLYENARPMVKLQGDTFEALAQAINDTELEGAVVSFDFTGDWDTYTDVRRRIAELKTLCHDAGAVHTTDLDSVERTEGVEVQAVDHLNIVTIIHDEIDNAMPPESSPEKVMATHALFDDIRKTTEAH